MGELTTVPLSISTFCMRSFLLVGTGGFLGAIARYYTYSLIRYFTFSSFPYTTMIVNVLGCFLGGLLMSLVEKTYPNHRMLIEFGMVGVLGGFTTYSTFGYETFKLIQNNQLQAAILNIVCSAVFGVIAVWIGFSIFK